MKIKRLVLLLLIGAMGFLVTGCEWMRWLRLLSLKKQLAEVERYVRVEEQGDLTLHFLKPVVYAEDLSMLIEGETSRTTNRNQVSWHWTYEKQMAGPNTEAGDFGMSFALGFENQKFNQLRFPQRFLTLMPKPMVVGMLRSMGQAEIDLKRGTVKMKWVAPPDKEKVELPTRAQISAVLGAPFLITESNQARTFVYKYYQKTSQPCSPAERLAWAKFTFAGPEDQVVSSEGVIGNVGWSLRRVPGEPEPRVTFALVPLSVEPVALKLPPAVADEYVGQYQEPAGTLYSFGRDGETFVASWTNGKSGGWCTAMPEVTNVFLGLPNGFPRYTFVRDSGGAVTGLVTRLDNAEKCFAKVASQLPAKPPVVRLEPAVYAAIAGRYKGAWGSTILISREGEQLFWQSLGIQTRVPLYPASETNFFFKAVDSPLTFQRNDKGEVTKFRLHFCGRSAEAVKQK